MSLLIFNVSALQLMRNVFSVGAAGILASLLLAGCATVPKSAVTAPSQFANADQSYTSDPVVQAFWRSYGDTRLDDLVQRALSANRDLRAAEARLRQSRNLARQSFLDFGPTGSLTVDHLTTKVGSSPATTSYGALPTASWEIDLFGRVRNTVYGRSADAEAALADMHGARVTVASETARVYFQLRGSSARLAVALANAENQRQTLGLTQARFEEGAGSELDLQRARTQLQTTLATVPQLATLQKQLLYQLAVLLGESPSQFAAPDLLEVQAIKLPELTPIGDPTEWMRRRPDIRRAEARLASAAAAAGVSIANLFPKVSFVGNARVSGAPSFSDLTDSAYQVTQFGPSLSWAVLNIPKQLFDVSVQRARRDESLATYEQTVLNALAETETALTAYRNSRQREVELEAAGLSSQRSEELSRVRYEAGAADFLSVLDAQRTQLQVADQLAQSHTDRATALIAVYKALGVGWDVQEAGQQLSPP
jgi:outer membrane protein, multidrug efflux system